MTLNICSILTVCIVERGKPGANFLILYILPPLEAKAPIPRQKLKNQKLTCPEETKPQFVAAAVIRNTLTAIR